MSEKRKSKLNRARDVCYIALFVGVLTICSWFGLFVGSIPITFQTLGVFLTAGFLGCKRGTVAVAAYVALGFCGVPVFAGFTGGIVKLAMPTGGYILGFLIATPVIGLAADKIKVENRTKAGWLLGLACLLGLILCYAVGMLWFMIYTWDTSSGVAFTAAFLTCVGPYLPLDMAKIVMAVFLVVKLRKYVRYW